ncbi:AraC family transcriptional regulator [Pedobacter cryoconitis]|uniref:AraC family transcriptional regulator n=1 Tax=Pedobacter cryoconitis TaxID=188932 RepID=UPI001615E726|nr:AraC family transcriptional regulator [Pedobacter cryoconitis]MBB5647108.1 AraC-like DNA-binding protein [Pedobacter cryoconitis]
MDKIINKSVLIENLELNDANSKEPSVDFYFQIIIILEGTGTRYVNHTSICYEPNDIFVFTPNDCRTFYPLTNTNFKSVKFTKQFYNQLSNVSKLNLGAIEEKINLSNIKGRKIIYEGSHDAEIIQSLVEIIEKESNSSKYQQQNLENIILVILNVIYRNIEYFQDNLESNYPEKKINAIISFIEKNIANPEKIKIEAIAREFNYSKTYINQYFKKYTKFTLKKYVETYRIAIASNHLKHSNKNIKNIALELGYTDESHFNKAFKSATGYTPSQFKK